MITRVFVSSTFTDLIEYRDCVQKVIRQLGALDISMESFGARDERPKEECLRIIREESDLFVGIYAHRYGFVSLGDEKSITELEYDMAIQVGIPRFIYIIDDNREWKPAFTDKDEKTKKLINFKNRLKEKHICKFFENKDQLASFVAADLGRHLSGIRIGKDIDLSEDLNSKFKVTQDDLRNTFIVHGGRNVSIEKMALIRKLSLRVLEDDVTDSEIIEWFYLLPNTLSPFEKTIAEKSRIFINGQLLEFPTPLGVYNAISRYKENKSTEDDEKIINKFIEIVRSVKKDKLQVLFGYFDK